MIKLNLTEQALIRLIEKAKSHERFARNGVGGPCDTEFPGLDWLEFVVKNGGLREEKKEELGLYIT